jgi:hypothetical protein
MYIDTYLRKSFSEFMQPAVGLKEMRAIIGITDACDIFVAQPKSPFVNRIVPNKTHTSLGVFRFGLQA